MDDRPLPYTVMTGWSWYQDCATLEEAYLVRDEIDPPEDDGEKPWERDRLWRPPTLLVKSPPEEGDGFRHKVPWPDGKTYKVAS